MTLSTCTGDVIVDRRSLVSGGHVFTTQLYTSGWACEEGGREGRGGMDAGREEKEGGREGGEGEKRKEELMVGGS